MKARAVVHTQVQWPMTIFGLPPRLTVVAIAAGASVYMLCWLVGLTALMMPAAFGSWVIGLFAAYRLGRADPHIESVLRGCGRFWRGARSRALLAGEPSTRGRR